MKINWKVRFKNPVFWFNLAASIFSAHAGLSGLQLGRHDKLAGCGERALTGRPEPCNRGVCSGIRMEPVKRPHHKRPKRFQPGAYLYRT